MTEQQSRAIKISNSNGQQTTGTLSYMVYTKQQRVARAAKTLGIFWGLAVVTLFIPLAHFVLVPGFFIAGPIVAYLRYRVTETVDKASGECPTCHEQVTIQLDASDRLPKWTYCSANNDPIQLSEA